MSLAGSPYRADPAPLCPTGWPHRSRGKHVVRRQHRCGGRHAAACEGLGQKQFIRVLCSTPAMKNNSIPKKQQIRGRGDLLLAASLALWCGVIDRYSGLSVSAGAT